MERFDFPSAMTVLIEHMNKERYVSQAGMEFENDSDITASLTATTGVRTIHYTIG